MAIIQVNARHLVVKCHLTTCSSSNIIKHDVRILALEDLHLLEWSKGVRRLRKLLVQGLPPSDSIKEDRHLQ
jgi:hypothetical protein